jgi:hypothetical protein
VCLRVRPSGIQESEMTLGYMGKQVRGLEDRIQELEAAREWKGDERRENDFSDQQTERIKILIDERAEVHAGRAFFRLVLWVVGTAAATSVTLLLTYFKIKG